ncbi:hypothetical protein PF010_g12509 [Phytophthora fragariae]|uniref:CUE domain-containing protein n=1 Tax=Phytophthora fragariae TaxID=53985 RepID=A0A6G0L341_9STRA|nr:hypothetical protein PF010_g12509 [Phytophthora fragariae]KAE9222818.1 hypothetical protein PF004_g12701 [Phytophthora fragariae]
METLRGVFPSVPTDALLRVLEVCDQSVAVASTWLLENDWQELLLDGEEEEAAEEEYQVSEVVPPVDNIPATSQSVAAAARANADQAVAPPPPPAQFWVRRAAGVFGFEEQLDDEEEDEAGEEEDDEDEEEDETYYDSGDDAAARVPPLKTRVKVSKGVQRKAGADDFWVAFDDHVVMKSMIELLNTTLSKLAHCKVVLLNQPAKEIDEAEAIVKLRSIVASGEKGERTDDGSSQSPRSACRGRGVALSRLLNRSSPRAVSATEVPLGQKRKRSDGTDSPPRQGFFAHFFPVRELDTIWRTVMHAHLFKGRFGEKIEFHTACGGPFSEKDFDELLHIQSSAASSRAASLGFSPLGVLKCCLVLPCLADEEEILRVGKNVHSVLKVQGNLYYRMVDSAEETNFEGLREEHFELLGDDEKMAEEKFRQFAQYRVKEEVIPNNEQKESKVAADPYMSYQQPPKSSYILEKLEGNKWVSH